MIRVNPKKLHKILDRLKTNIEQKENLTITLSPSTLIWLHDALLIVDIIQNKIKGVRVANDELADEISELQMDFVSETESFIYELINVLGQENKGDKKGFEKDIKNIIRETLEEVLPMFIPRYYQPVQPPLPLPQYPPQGPYCDVKYSTNTDESYKQEG